jgi:hypothetical protein
MDLDPRGQFIMGSYPDPIWTYLWPLGKNVVKKIVNHTTFLILTFFWQVFESLRKIMRNLVFPTTSDSCLNPGGQLITGQPDPEHCSIATCKWVFLINSKKICFTTFFQLSWNSLVWIRSRVRVRIHQTCNNLMIRIPPQSSRSGTLEAAHPNLCTRHNMSTRIPHNTPLSNNASSLQRI